MHTINKLLVSALTALLLLALITTGACDYITGADRCTQTQDQRIYDVITEKAYSLIMDNTDNPDFMIIDVRTAEEYTSGYIEGARNIDVSSGDFTTQLDKFDKEKTYLIYCRSGKRSASARDIMAKLSFISIYNMSGGIVEWEAKGLPVVR